MCVTVFSVCRIWGYLRVCVCVCMGVCVCVIIAIYKFAVVFISAFFGIVIYVNQVMRAKIFALM